MKDIDFSEPEKESSTIRRPFTVKIEEDVAKGFIAAVKNNGWFVRETLVKLMREFTKTYGTQEGENGKPAVRP